ncbi:C-C chemokine receptor type 3-like [Acipenser ruthenus]|uniref:C-C chemokine receptor type 3-like n=1 Tax=Acipenser ruthenus TaxID=7906 RepID=UPI00145B245D|nr:C-C chemokine receptor type 3-like [Acipenser ruthenus]
MYLSNSSSSSSPGADLWHNCSSLQDLTLPQMMGNNCPSIDGFATLLFPALYFLFFPLGVLTNLLNVWVCVRRGAQPWSISTIGVLSLALSDLAFLLCMPLWGVYLLEGYRWTMGRPLCLVMNVLYYTGLTSSTMFICAISSDRFLAIVFPLRSRQVRTLRNAALVSLMIWSLTGVLVYLSFPNFLYWERPDGGQYCGVLLLAQVSPSQAPYNLLSYYSVQVAIPLAIVLPCYVTIVERMLRSRRRWRAAGQGGPARARDKTVRLITLIITNFLVCWVPGQLLQVVACVLFLTLETCENECSLNRVAMLLLEVSQVLSVLNSCLEPLIFQLQQGLWQKLRAQGGRAVARLRSWRSGRGQSGGPPPPPVELISVIHSSKHCRRCPGSAPPASVLYQGDQISKAQDRDTDSK